MAKGGTGTNTGTIVSTYTKKRAAIDYSKKKRKQKKANKCLACYWNNEGYCNRSKDWCYIVSRGGCNDFAEK